MLKCREGDVTTVLKSHRIIKKMHSGFELIISLMICAILCIKIEMFDVLVVLIESSVVETFIYPQTVDGFLLHAALTMWLKISPSLE